ncbi:unnamed protein product [Gongylonema pulchrum]|uniref:Uncharacterized protein n=1 Tax=Gongylonema pulchrum TaxID=637853 RepID=A0A183DSJ6_9BILA|nr:unnamed protein product [Gongylonema pulchrum]
MNLLTGVMCEAASSDRLIFMFILAAAFVTGLPVVQEDRCLAFDGIEHALHDAMIPNREAFYKIFEVLQNEKKDFADGKAEVLIGVTYRRGDGFRLFDGSAPNDLSFLKFNPIDNLDDEDNQTIHYCLRFTIKVGK